MFKDLYKLNFLLELKIPIFKMGEESLKASKNVGVVLNDSGSYEQISPIVLMLLLS